MIFNLKLYRMYRISKNKRKYSSTPIVRITLDAQGKELEEIVCVCTEKKEAGDRLAENIVRLLNNNILTFEHFKKMQEKQPIYIYANVKKPHEEAVDEILNFEFDKNDDK